MLSELIIAVLLCLLFESIHVPHLSPVSQNNSLKRSAGGKWEGGFKNEAATPLPPFSQLIWMFDEKEKKKNNLRNSYSFY